MIASLLVAQHEDQRWAREADLRAKGFTTRELYGLDELSEEKRAVLDGSGEPPRKRRKQSQPQASRQQARQGGNEVGDKTLIYNPWAFPEPFVERFQALARRNLFIIQLHHATSNHYDLRLLCSEAHDEATISFAIKKGLSGMKANEKRLAVETPLHGVDYSVHEGAGVGTTLMHDIGFYEIVSGHTSIRDKGADTDDEDDEQEKSSLFGGTKGINHERALAKSYRGEPGDASTSFVVRLIGERFQIQLAMSHQRTDVKYGLDRLRGRKTTRKQWVIGLATSDNGRVRLNKEKKLGPNSILTGRSMEEVKTEGHMLSGEGLEDCRDSDLEDVDVLTSA